MFITYCLPYEKYGKKDECNNLEWWKWAYRKKGVKEKGINSLMSRYNSPVMEQEWSKENENSDNECHREKR